MASIVLQNVIIRYPHLDRPWSGSQTIEADYNCQIIFPQNWPQWSQLQECVNETLREGFGAIWPQNLKLPWLNKYLQPNQQKDGPYQGCYYVNVVGKGTKPPVSDQNVEPIPDLEIKQKIFSGCVVNIQVNFATYQQGPGVGTYFGRAGVQLINNNVEPIADAGSVDPKTVFQSVPGAPAPTANVPGGGGAPWE